MRRRLVAALVLSTSAVTVAAVLPADAQTTRHTEVVSADPVDWTPHVLDGMVHAITVVGDSVVLGGDFNLVSDADGSGAMRVHNLVAFHRTTGRIDRSFRPVLDGPVYALAPGDAGTVYVGGAFTSVNEAGQTGLTRLRIATGTRQGSGPAMAATGGDVRALRRHGTGLYVGGAFRSIGGRPHAALAKIDTDSDRVDPGFDLALAEPRSGRLRVQDMAVSPDGTRLVIDGTFTQVAGASRKQIAMIDLTSAPPRPADWSTDTYAESCHTTINSNLRGIDFAPDGSYFVVVTTAHRDGTGPMCGTVARFETGAAGGGQRPSWVNRTGGDSLYSVAATGSAVYVGGHQRWLDNRSGDERDGPGPVYRPGIGAIDPDTGRALSWNPTRSRGVGVRSMVATSDGLWVGSDTDELGGEYHARIGMFPLG